MVVTDLSMEHHRERSILITNKRIFFGPSLTSFCSDNFNFDIIIFDTNVCGKCLCQGSIDLEAFVQYEDVLVYQEELDRDEDLVEYGEDVNYYKEVV